MAAAQEPVKGGKMEEETFSEIIQNEAFLEWFWDNNNGNSLADKLNTYAEMKGLDRRIRREKESPVEEIIDKKKVEVQQSGERDGIDVDKDIKLTTVPPKKIPNRGMARPRKREIAVNF